MASSSQESIMADIPRAVWLNCPGRIQPYFDYRCLLKPEMVAAKELDQNSEATIKEVC